MSEWHVFELPGITAPLRGLLSAILRDDINSTSIMLVKHGPARTHLCG